MSASFGEKINLHFSRKKKKKFKWFMWNLFELSTQGESVWEQHEENNSSGRSMWEAREGPSEHPDLPD